MSPVDAVNAEPGEVGCPRCGAASPGLAVLALGLSVDAVVAGVAILYLNPRIKFDDKKPHTQVELAQWTNIAMMN